MYSVDIRFCVFRRHILMFKRCTISSSSYYDRLPGGGSIKPLDHSIILFGNLQDIVLPRKLIHEPQMRSCSSHLSNKNVLSNFRKESKLKDGSFILAGSSFQIVGPQTLNDLGPNVTVLVLGMYSCPEVADREQLSPTGYRRNYDAVGCQIRRCQSIQTSIHQSGDLENYPLSHWQPMKVAQHWRDVIVFPSTSDEPCCRVLDTLQTSQELPADTVQ